MKSKCKESEYEYGWHASVRNRDWSLFITWKNFVTVFDEAQTKKYNPSWWWWQQTINGVRVGLIATPIAAWRPTVVRIEINENNLTISSNAFRSGEEKLGVGTEAANCDTTET